MPPVTDIPRAWRGAPHKGHTHGAVTTTSAHTGDDTNPAPVGKRQGSQWSASWCWLEGYAGRESPDAGAWGGVGRVTLYITSSLLNRLAFIPPRGETVFWSSSFCLSTYNFPGKLVRETRPTRTGTPEGSRDG